MSGLAQGAEDIRQGGSRGGTISAERGSTAHLRRQIKVQVNVAHGLVHGGWKAGPGPHGVDHAQAGLVGLHGGQD